MPHFAAGGVRFQRDVFPQKKDLFDTLSQGQSPDVMAFNEGFETFKPAADRYASDLAKLATENCSA